MKIASIILLVGVIGLGVALVIAMALKKPDAALAPTVSEQPIHKVPEVKP